MFLCLIIQSLNERWEERKSGCCNVMKPVTEPARWLTGDFYVYTRTHSQALLWHILQYTALIPHEVITNLLLKYF